SFSLDFFFQAEDGIRDFHVTGVQTCALPISVPGEARAAATRASVRLDSQVYVKRLEDVMHGPPVTVDRQAPLRAAAASMVDKHIGSLLIVDDDDRPSGILTERDLLRASAAGTDALSQLAVGDAMTSPVEVMDSG